MRNIISGFLTAAIVGGTFVATSVQAHDKEVHCLAQNVYHEARGESLEGQIAVAYVTINRRDHDYFPDTICDVVWDDGQFEWTQDGKSDRTPNKEAWIKALDVADLVMSGSVEDPTNGSLFFHATYVKWGWSDRLDYSATIGNHVFYQWDGNWNNDNVA